MEHPNWFKKVIGTGLGRLTAARLNFRPQSENEIILTTQEWADGLWSVLKPKPEHAEKLLITFGCLAVEMIEWPKPAEFIERYYQVIREPDPDQQRIEYVKPAPKTPEEIQKNREARHRFFLEMEKIGLKAPKDHILSGNKIADKIEITE